MTALAALIEDALHGLPAIDGDPYGRYHAARALDHAWSKTLDGGRITEEDPIKKENAA